MAGPHGAGSHSIWMHFHPTSAHIHVVKRDDRPSVSKGNRSWLVVRHGHGCGTISVCVRAKRHSCLSVRSCLSGRLALRSRRVKWQAGTGPDANRESRYLAEETRAIQ